MKNSRFIFIIFIFFYSLGISQEIKDGDDDKVENSVSGNVFMGDNLLEGGRVFLIRNSKTLSSTASNSEVFNGGFRFENIDFDNYSLYVIPSQSYDFFYFPKYLPTYLGDVCNWENAIINDESRASNQNFDIHLSKYSEPFYGHGKISGKIKYGKLYDGNKVIPISILLLNSEKVPMDFRIANEVDGSFLFENLPDGKYYIHPEIPGFVTSDFEIIVKSRNSNRVDFRINDNSIEKEQAEEKKVIPIVTQEGIKIFIDKNNTSPIICELTDLSGKMIFKEMFSTNDILINTSHITTGIYLLRARTYSNLIVKTSKVYINNK